MMLVVNLSEVAAEEKVLEIVKNYSRFYKVKSRNITSQGLDMIVEVRVKEEGAFVRQVAELSQVHAASLISHDGEVTF